MCIRDSLGAGAEIGPDLAGAVGGAFTGRDDFDGDVRRAGNRDSAAIKVGPALVEEDAYIGADASGFVGGKFDVWERCAYWGCLEVLAQARAESANDQLVFRRWTWHFDQLTLCLLYTSRCV